MKTFLAFINGMREFRSDYTTSYDHVETDEGDRLQNAYEHGRDFAHRITFRHFDAE